MAFRNIREVITAWEDGRCWNSFFHKVSTPTLNTARWGDMAMGAGTPVYQPYVGNALEATPLIGQKNQGIYTGAVPPAGMDKYLASVSLIVPGTTGQPFEAWLCDYLMFYPLVDGDNTDEQVMDNTATLPRYSDGLGVQATIISAAPVTQDADITIKYTNADGVQKTTTQRIWSATNTGSVLNLDMPGATSVNNNFPFIRLVDSRGIRQVDSVQMSTGSGGLFTILLVKPLVMLRISEGAIPVERCFITNQMLLPQIFPGAYLNFFFYATASTNPGNLRGQLDFIWG